MKVSVLIIASEVLDAKITDTNTRLIAEHLRQHHVELHQCLAVRDIEASILKGLEFLSGSADVVITSGGVGPTRDDITKEVLGKFLNRRLVKSRSSEETAIKNYRRFERDFPGGEHPYTLLPEGFEPLNNPVGFAPGFAAEANGKVFMSFPGVPRELAAMLKEHFLRLAGQKLPQTMRELFTARTWGVPEEKIFGELDPSLWQKLEEFGEVSSLPVVMGVDIGVRLEATSAAELAQKRAAIQTLLEASPVAPHVWHIGRKSTEEVLVEKARALGLRFGFAESATGGLCAHRVTNVPGASAVFVGGVVSYATEMKLQELGVSRATVEAHGVVSAEVALEMAIGLARKLKLDAAASITGLAGPGDDGKNPVGTVFIGLWIRGQGSVRSFSFKGDRDLLKQRFSQAALMLLLLGLEENSHS